MYVLFSYRYYIPFLCYLWKCMVLSYLILFNYNIDILILFSGLYVILKFVNLNYFRFSNRSTNSPTWFGSFIWLFSYIPLPPNDEQQLPSYPTPSAQSASLSHIFILCTVSKDYIILHRTSYTRSIFSAIKKHYSSTFTDLQLSYTSSKILNTIDQ